MKPEKKHLLWRIMKELPSRTSSTCGGKGMSVTIGPIDVNT
jgi:hypothetical protein